MHQVLKQRPTAKGSFLSRQEIKPATISLTLPSDPLVDESGKECNSLPLVQDEKKTENASPTLEFKSNDNTEALVPDTVSSVDKKEGISNPNLSPNSDLPPAAVPAAASLAVVGVSMSEPERGRLDGAGAVANTNTTQSSRIGDRGLIKIKFHRPNHNRKGILGKTLGSQRGSVSFYIDRMQLPSLLNAGQENEQGYPSKVLLDDDEDVTAVEQAEEIDEMKAMAELDAVLGRHSLPVTIGGPHRSFQVVARVPSLKEIPSKRSPRIKTIREESSSISENDPQFVDSIHDDDNSIKSLDDPDPRGATSAIDCDNNNRAKSPLYYFGGAEYSLSRPHTENDNDSVSAGGGALPVSEKHPESLLHNKISHIILTSSADESHVHEEDGRVPSLEQRVVHTPVLSPPERDTTLQSNSFTDGLSPLNHFTDFETPHSKGNGRLSSVPNSADSEYNRFRELILEDMGLLSGAGYREAISRIKLSTEMKKGTNYPRPGPHTTKTSASKTFPVRQQLLVERPPNRPLRARPSASYRSTTTVKGFAGIVPQEKLRQRLAPARPAVHGEEGSQPPCQAQQVKRAAYMRAEKALFYLEKDSEADEASISAQQIATFLHQELVLEYKDKESTALKVVVSEESRSELDADNESRASQRKWISFPSVPSDIGDNNEEIIDTAS